jgi:hypothetical protein
MTRCAFSTFISSLLCLANQHSPRWPPHTPSNAGRPSLLPTSSRFSPTTPLTFLSSPSNVLNVNCTPSPFSSGIGSRLASTLDQTAACWDSDNPYRPRQFAHIGDEGGREVMICSRIEGAIDGVRLESMSSEGKRMAFAAYLRVSLTFRIRLHSRLNETACVMDSLVPPNVSNFPHGHLFR